MEPFPLSVRYAFGCKILVLRENNQPVGVVFVLGCCERGLFCVFSVHVVDLLCTGGGFLFGVLILFLSLIGVMFYVYCC